MILEATLPLLHSLSSVSPEARLRRAARRGRPVALGTPAVPYEPAGRSPLAALKNAEGLEIAVVTRSPEITRELELLADLDRRCSVTVDLLMPIADAALLEAAARLAAEGIASRVLCPLVAGVNDGEASLRKLVAAAREAGAWDVRFLPAPGNRLLRSRKKADGATFRRLRLEYGFPRETPGRG
jgi:DNA repair photolyase